MVKSESPLRFNKNLLATSYLYPSILGLKPLACDGKFSINSCNILLSLVCLRYVQELTNDNLY